MLGIAALKRAIEVLGGQVPTGKVIGVGQSTVSECIRNGKRVPAEWCLPLEAATAAAGEKISRAQFRPDLWPEEFAALPPPPPKPTAERPREKAPVAHSRGLRAMLGGG